MAYSAEADVEVQFPLLTACATGAITEYISQADSEIDAMLRELRYTIPLGSTPAVIKKLSIYKAGLMGAIEVAGTSQENKPFPFEPLQDMIEKLEGLIKNGELGLARSGASASITRREYYEDDISEFTLDSNVPLDNEDA